MAPGCEIWFAAAWQAVDAGGPPCTCTSKKVLLHLGIMLIRHQCCLHDAATRGMYCPQPPSDVLLPKCPCLLFGYGVDQAVLASHASSHHVRVCGCCVGTVMSTKAFTGVRDIYMLIAFVLESTLGHATAIHCLMVAHPCASCSIGDKHPWHCCNPQHDSCICSRDSP